MSLASGTRLGPYEVLSSLGAGGMGEVYRARDTQLDRDVAIKILPQTLAHDADRVARFQKPANIKVREDGTVKVLDFGLAKVVGPAEAGHYVPHGGVRNLQGC